MAFARTYGRSLAWAVPITVEAAALGRSIVLAWALGPDELGRAMMLALTLRLVEMMSDVGIEKLLVQAPDGNTSTFQAQMHGVSVVRALVSGLAILSLAPLMAATFADGPAATSYAALALAPLLRGFAHLDYRRAERHLRYMKMAVVESGATVFMVASLAPALWVFPDHRAMCIVLLAHAAAHGAFTHLIATRPYVLRFSRVSLERSMRFGGPLVLNACLLFLTFYADRLIVAYAYGWETLAIYGVALQLALLPAQIVGRASASLDLPRLRRACAAGTLDVFWPRLLMFYVLLAGAMAAAMVAVGPYLIAFVYGESYRPDLALAIALATAASFRVLRTPFSQRAVATARTGDPARANVIRALAVVPAAGCAALGLPLAAIAAAAALGEAGATVRAFLLTRITKGPARIEEVYA